jgi:hypothetical protein
VRLPRIRTLKNLARDGRYTCRNRSIASIAASSKGGSVLRINDERQLEDVFTAERALLYKHSPT